MAHEIETIEINGLYKLDGVRDARGNRCNRLTPVQFSFKPEEIWELAKKCLSLLEEQKHLLQFDIRLSPIQNNFSTYYSLDFIWEHRLPGGSKSTFCSLLPYDDLANIFGLYLTNKNIWYLDATEMDTEQKIKVCKSILKNLWEGVQDNVL